MMVSEALFRVIVGYFGWMRHYFGWVGMSGSVWGIFCVGKLSGEKWGIILGGWGRVGNYFG